MIIVRKQRYNTGKNDAVRGKKMRERGKQENLPLQPAKAPVADRGAHNPNDGGSQGLHFTLFPAQKASGIVNGHGLDLVVADAGLLECPDNVAEDVYKGPVDAHFFGFLHGHLPSSNYKIRKAGLPFHTSRSSWRGSFSTRQGT